MTVFLSTDSKSDWNFKFLNGGKLKSLTKNHSEGLMSIPEMGLNLDHRVVEFCFIKLIMLKMYFVDNFPMKIVLTL